ncbi:MAG: DUF4131 domain-containing protein [Actinobacteria bacterium]|nr:DUF4131 domain-containing protein [Actinomycetota bacterium]
MTTRVRVTAPHMVVGGLCVGLSLALVVDAPGVAVLPIAAAFALVALAVDGPRAVLLALSLVLVGWWWASVRLERLDASALADEIGRAAPARVEVTGPPRRSEFALRVPVDVLRFGDVVLDEPARLELPPERAPPQGAILDLVASIRRPRTAESTATFDEATYLRREGVHVVLQASPFGRRRPARRDRRNRRCAASPTDDVDRTPARG